MKTQNTENQLLNLKRQSRPVGVPGGFINQMMGNNSTEPKVGEGATVLMYSDRHAYEVIEVSDCGNSCVIRKMDTAFIGKSYGDERYKYSSNEENHTYTLEWNHKKGQWEKVWTSIEIIKSLAKKLQKEYGWGWHECLPNGVNYKDLLEFNEKTGSHQLKLVEGLTKQYKCTDKVSIIFGVMEQYNDPSF